MNNWHWVINAGKCNYRLDGIATKTVIFAMKASVNYDKPVTSIHNVQISTANCSKNGATCKGNGDRRRWRWPSGWTLGFINVFKITLLCHGNGNYQEASQAAMLHTFTQLAFVGHAVAVGATSKNLIVTPTASVRVNPGWWMSCPCCWWLSCT